MAREDYRFEDAASYLAWVRARPARERWRYVDGYAVLEDGLWDGEHWHPAPRENPLRLIRRRLSRAIVKSRRPDFSTPDKFLDWSRRKRDDP